jgi:two-component system LytT family response regulator
LDIELADTTGFEIAEYIESSHKGIPYVFLTGFASYAIDGYKYEPLDFLTKPIDFMRLRKVFKKLDESKKEAVFDKIVINTDDGFALFAPNEILYIEKSSRKNILHTVDGRKYVINYTLNEVENMLKGYGFFRCHQSFLIYTGNVTEIKSTEFGRTHVAVMAGKETVPVSRAKYLILKEKLQSSGAVFM